MFLTCFCNYALPEIVSTGQIQEAKALRDSFGDGSFPWSWWTHDSSSEQFSHVFLKKRLRDQCVLVFLLARHTMTHALFWIRSEKKVITIGFLVRFNCPKVLEGYKRSRAKADSNASSICRSWVFTQSLLSTHIGYVELQSS